MDKLLFVINNLLAVWIAVLISDLFFTDRKPHQRLLAILSIFPILVLGAVLLLGSFAWLSVSSVALLLTGLLALVLLVYWRRRSTLCKPFAAASTPNNISPNPWFFKIIILMVGGVCIGFLAGRFILPGAYFTVDDLHYHATSAAHWLTEQRLAFSYVYQTHFPHNAEVLSFWFVLPFHADGLAGLAAIYWLALTVVAMVSISLARGFTLSAALLTGGVILSSREILHQTATFSGVDLAVPAMLTAALAWTLTHSENVTPNSGNASPPPENTSLRPGYAALVLSGLCAGFALGCKISVAPALVVLFLYFLCRKRPVNTWRRRLSDAGLFALSALAVGSYWYLRNFIFTGNPIFPAQFGPFDGPLTSAIQQHSKLINWIARAPGDLNQWLYLLKRHVSWPPQLFLLAALGYAYAAYGLIHRKTKPNHNSSAPLLLLIIGLVLLTGYLFMPFSGAVDSPIAQLRIDLRFVIAPFLMGIALYAPLLQGKHRRFWWGLTILAAFSAWIYKGYYIIALFAAVGAVVLMVLRRPALSRRLLSPMLIQRRFFLLIFLPAILSSLALCQPYLQQKTDERLFRFEYHRQLVGPDWRNIEMLPAGARIAYFGPDVTKYYPFFGRKLQFVPTMVQKDGSPAVPLYQQWRRNPQETTWWWEQKKSPPNLTLLPDNLIAAGIDYAFIRKNAAGNWPPAHAVLADTGKFKLIHQDEYTIIWRITP